MTAQEMHIDIRQQTNQIGSNRDRKLLDEQIDWHINKMQESFVRQKIKPRKDGSGGFETDGMQMDDIRTLIVEDKVLPAYISGDDYVGFLPHDYKYLLSDSSLSLPVCKDTELPAIVPVTYYLNKVRLAKTTKTVAPYYLTGAVFNGGKTFNIPGSLNEGISYAGLPGKEDIFQLRESISLYAGWHWEQFGDQLYPNCFVTASAGQQANSLVWDGFVILGGTSELKTASVRSNDNDKLSWNPNRLSKHDKVRELNRTSYYKSSATSPLSSLSGGSLKVYGNASLIVSGIRISYIRKFRPVSLSLSSNSELPEAVHQNLCDMTAQFIMGRYRDAEGLQVAAADKADRIVL